MASNGFLWHSCFILLLSVKNPGQCCAVSGGVGIRHTQSHQLWLEDLTIKEYSGSVEGTRSVLLNPHSPSGVPFGLCLCVSFVFFNWIAMVFFDWQKHQVSSEGWKAGTPHPTCSLRDHTHRWPLETSQRPLAPSSTTFAAPEGSGLCSHWQWSLWRTHRQREADKWWGQSQCQSGGLLSHHLVQRRQGWGIIRGQAELKFHHLYRDCAKNVPRQTDHHHSPLTSFGKKSFYFLSQPQAQSWMGACFAGLFRCLGRGGKIYIWYTDHWSQKTTTYDIDTVKTFKEYFDRNLIFFLLTNWI